MTIVESWFEGMIYIQYSQLELGELANQDCFLQQQILEVISILICTLHSC